MSWHWPGNLMYKKSLSPKGKDTEGFQPLKGQEGGRKRKKEDNSLSETI